MSSLPTSLWRRKERYIREAKVEKLDYLGTSLSMAALVEKWTWTVNENFGPHEESLMCYCCGMNAYAEAELGLLFPNHSADIILVLSTVLLGLKVFLLLTFLVNLKWVDFQRYYYIERNAKSFDSLTQQWLSQLPKRVINTAWLFLRTS